jgi:ribosomal protein S12 methylthiotransferase accessory factor YcaO
VALDFNRERAMKKAYQELVERDFVLRSWWGEIKPEKISLKGSWFLSKEIQKNLLKLSSEYLVELYNFGQSFDGICVMGVFIHPIGLERKNNYPIVYGFGSRSSASQAFEHALNEALQRLGFLKDEKLKDYQEFSKEVSFSPSPLYHQEYYLTYEGNEKIMRWLEGDYYAPLSEPTPRQVSNANCEWDILAPHLIY